MSWEDTGSKNKEMFFRPRIDSRMMGREGQEGWLGEVIWKGRLAS